MSVAFAVARLVGAFVCSARSGIVADGCEAVVHEMHAVEVREAGRPSRASRAEEIADRERELADKERDGAQRRRERGDEAAEKALSQLTP